MTRIRHIVIPAVNTNPGHLAYPWGNNGFEVLGCGAVTDFPSLGYYSYCASSGEVVIA